MLAQNLTAACSLCSASRLSCSLAIKRATYSNNISTTSDFQWFPDFFSLSEQHALLTAALRKLDAADSRQLRRRRKEYALNAPRDDGSSLEFLPDELYDFQEGHYDGVIRRFREIHVSSWPDDVEGLSGALDRLRGIYPSPDVQTHLLHLASDGEILPHVDNLGASGSWILGISLGATRVLKLESDADPEEIYTLAVPSGSVYVQSDSIRYGFKHSILLHGEFDGHQYSGGQRMSIMVRDLHEGDAQS
ncbi:hypothetical protein FOMPIDRAFT_130573 [Fomitopsis schrenkii]|uniref:Alpha-ketoglutarate-dependent dioxygenase AlkB-like domain-containing protein n=1 Tax=Fomitopsis schrenkii TaxID=2126942 RepID=S8F437_FOMSC|nr:hypothetical protein FOMPIDRAFT_130573 [Fomitopsis schrenkii]